MAVWRMAGFKEGLDVVNFLRAREGMVTRGVGRGEIAAVMCNVLSGSFVGCSSSWARRLLLDIS